MGLLSEQRVVVTGAGDIGRSVATTLVESGAEVEIWDSDEGALEAARLPSRVVDVTNPEAVDIAVESALPSGPLTGMVTTAGILTIAPVIDLDPAEWRNVIDVNLTGTFLCCRAAARRMLSEHPPAVDRSIVTISSIGGLRGEAEIAHYCASKFGVLGLTQSMSRELGPVGIRVNSVCPGAVDSRMNTELIDAYAATSCVEPAAAIQDVVGHTALRRLARPADVGGTVVYLLSDLSRFVTGEAIAVTGGLVL